MTHMHGEEKNVEKEIGRKRGRRRNWKQIEEAERWDEWPERIDDPPLNTEIHFWYKDISYLVTEIRDDYLILEENTWNIIVKSKNFRVLLEKKIFIDGKTFKELVPKMWFEL